MRNLDLPRTARFIEAMASPNVASARQAAMDAGYAASSASVVAQQLMNDPDVLAAIQVKRETLARLPNISASMVLKRMFDIATADPAKLIRIRRLNCRHCWGIDHQYQWAEWEFAEAAARVMDWKPKKAGEERPAFPDDAGGMGWAFNADPCPHCPRCRGEGHVDIFLADTGALTGAERLLYAGVKQTKDGLQVLMHDQPAMLRALADYFGLSVKPSGAPTAPGGWPKAPHDPDVVDIDEVLPDDPNKLALMYQELTK